MGVFVCVSECLSSVVLAYGPVIDLSFFFLQSYGIMLSYSSAAPAVQKKKKKIQHKKKSMRLSFTVDPCVSLPEMWPGC